MGNRGPSQSRREEARNAARAAGIGMKKTSESSGENERPSSTPSSETDKDKNQPGEPGDPSWKE